MYAVFTQIFWLIYCRSYRPHAMQSHVKWIIFWSKNHVTQDLAVVNFVVYEVPFLVCIYEATMKQRSHGKKLNCLQQYLSRRFRIINCAAQHKMLLHFNLCKEQQKMQTKNALQNIFFRLCRFIHKFIL